MEDYVGEVLVAATLLFLGYKQTKIKQKVTNQKIRTRILVEALQQTVEEMKTQKTYLYDFSRSGQQEEDSTKTGINFGNIMSRNNSEQKIQLDVPSSNK